MSKIKIFTVLFVVLLFVVANFSSKTHAYCAGPGCVNGAKFHYTNSSNYFNYGSSKVNTPSGTYYDYRYNAYRGGYYGYNRPYPQQTPTVVNQTSVNNINITNNGQGNINQINTTKTSGLFERKLVEVSCGNTRSKKAKKARCYSYKYVAID